MVTKYQKGGLVERVSRVFESSGEKKVNREYEEKSEKSEKSVKSSPIEEAANKETRNREKIDAAERKALGYADGGRVNIHGVRIRRPLTMAQKRTPQESR